MEKEKDIGSSTNEALIEKSGDCLETEADKESVEEISEDQFVMESEEMIELLEKVIFDAEKKITHIKNTMDRIERLRDYGYRLIFLKSENDLHIEVCENIQMGFDKTCLRKF